MKNRLIAAVYRIVCVAKPPLLVHMHVSKTHLKTLSTNFQRTLYYYGLKWRFSAIEYFDAY